jgi:hypothetical protein
MPTLTKALIALLPTGILLAGSTVMFLREKRPWSVLQLLGAAGMIIVAVSHVCEAVQILPWMRWGTRIGWAITLTCSAQSLALRCSRSAFFSMRVR